MLGLWVLGLTLAAGRADGQTPPGMPSRVRVLPPTCTAGPFDTTAWLAFVRDELITDGVGVVELAPSPSENDPSLAVLHAEVVPCRADTTVVTLSIDDLVTRKSVRRAVALDDIPPRARPRALALAMAELLRASWAELALVDAPEPSSPPPEPIRRAVLVRLRPAVLAAPTNSLENQPSAPPTAVTVPAHAWWATASLDLRTFPGQSGVLLGGRAVLSWSPWSTIPLRLRVDLGSAYGSTFTRRGEVSLVASTLGVAAQLGGGTDRIDLSVGPRTELGWARVTGRPFNAPDTAVTGDGFVWFLALACTLRVRLAPRWWAVFDLATGQTLNSLTVVSEGQRVTGIEGPMLTVSLGLGVSW
jgi:hypothetical protein